MLRDGLAAGGFEGGAGTCLSTLVEFEVFVTLEGGQQRLDEFAGSRRVAVTVPKPHRTHCRTSRASETEIVVKRERSRKT